MEVRLSWQGRGPRSYYGDLGPGSGLGVSSGRLVTPLLLLSFSITIPVQTFSNLQIRGQ